ncbi:uncharacterized protein [Dendropsophus ebraccatus]|uniref:uncharacterized protein isoform X2 n=1 Tax=Dendropsophus ebraccatus TaxID=150705 RepID=UPI0038310EAB
MSDDQLLQLLTARLQSADEEFLGRLRTALSPPATSAAVAPNEAPPARRSQRIRNRSGSSSSSHDSPGHSRHGRHRRHSRRCSRSSRCSRRSRSSRWRSPSTSEWSSGESGRRSIRMRPEPPPSRSLSLVHCEVPPVVVPPPPPTIPSGLGVSVPPARGGRPWPFMPGSHLGHSGQQLMALISSSVTPPTWQRHGTVKPVIWLLGHSYIVRASQRAEFRPGGLNLGFRDLDVNWRGIRGLRWPQVLPEVVDIGRGATSPVILVLHAGGNDLCSMRMAELMTLMRADIERFQNFFTEMIFVWSEIISRVAWQGARDSEAVERARRSVNSRVSRFVRSRAGVVVRHRQLEGDNSRLMVSDGTHLTDIGSDIFLSGIQDGIEQAMFLLGGGRSPV